MQSVDQSSETYLYILGVSVIHFGPFFPIFFSFFDELFEPGEGVTVPMLAYICIFAASGLVPRSMRPCNTLIFLDDVGDSAVVVAADGLTDGDNLGIGISVRRLFCLLEEGAGILCFGVGVKMDDASVGADAGAGAGADAGIAAGATAGLLISP